jgi:hypothetical protein
MRNPQQGMRAASESCAGPHRRMLLIGTVIACGLAILTRTAAAETFSARQTHRGFTTDQGSDTPGALVATSWPRPTGDPTFVYEAGGVPVAGVWRDGAHTEVVRSGTSEDAPVIGRIVSSWEDHALRLTIEPVSGAAIRTDAFTSGGGQNGPTLSRDIPTRAELQGTYRTTLRSAVGAKTGWLNVQIDAEGATRFTGDLPRTIPPALAAAVAEAVDHEVDVIYQHVVDVGPLSR